ncbi:hypothetical protein A2348_01670 [Candidatus Uhrbacteria bacterium RIFOXYB12_FULL_58_10]|uniref:Uncharacterized protein n=1 Tax=Candidatus Uhrbacteria bacterium RIFOXYB2_FULL_57_15 TaxID=1802422 RepID=A0A1F7W9R6_9BACT|nr:MAG: hypothetical protein A2348_01670 [Candidatus Uhrbacteria bacterium RIFOXYB12_FULL_58_10]OGL99563.1 MAG: hypothetical protein A2304_05520 [Candidatus Uhrbacteria bacterium RIFOXYB2_FULL_57_15]OGL99838.1 MAG: hypothetical protein A2501_05415 [Candidatus Uhrbacteria bacterium RIFOXYC12_FULL_57_11]
MSREGSGIDRRVASSRGTRFREIALLALAMLVVAPKPAEAHDSRSPDNAWAQIRGENTEERAKEIDELERECSVLEARIAKLGAHINEETVQDRNRYQRDPGLKFQERGKLRDAERELRQKEAAIGRLKNGSELGVERMENQKPKLDLSANNLGNEVIAKYYDTYKVGWKDHAIYFDVQDGTPDGARAMIRVGPEFTDADFYFEDGGKDLRIVFTTVTGGHKTLLLDDGYYGGFFESSKSGKPIPTEIE